MSTAWASPSGASCCDVGDLDAERGAVADRGLDLAAVSADDDPDLGEPGAAIASIP